MPHSLSYDEADHDARRARQWLAGQARGEGFARPRLLELGTAMTALAAAERTETLSFHVYKVAFLGFNTGTA
ncbi:hypothetical protein AB0C00_23500, partial [Micromonospora carbonacea]